MRVFILPSSMCNCIAFTTSLLSVLVTCPTVQVWEVFLPSIFLRATKTLHRLKWLTDWLLTMLRANRARQTLRYCGTSYHAGSKFAQTHSPLLREYFYRCRVVSLTVEHSPHYRPELLMKIETLKSEYINGISGNFIRTTSLINQNVGKIFICII